jgi:hypothetical protein
VPVLPDDVVALLESGCSTFIGAVEPDGAPVASHCMGVQVVDDGTHLRVMVNGEEEHAIAALQATGVVALGATDVYTLRSIQVKGRAVRVEPVTADDRVRTDRYIAEFLHAIHETDGTEHDLAKRAVPRKLVALVMTIAEVFEQTPGPQAGTVLSGT